MKLWSKIICIIFLTLCSASAKATTISASSQIIKFESTDNSIKGVELLTPLHNCIDGGVFIGSYDSFESNYTRVAQVLPYYRWVNRKLTTYIIEPKFEIAKYTNNSIKLGIGVALNEYDKPYVIKSIIVQKQFNLFENLSITTGVGYGDYKNFEGTILSIGIKNNF